MQRDKNRYLRPRLAVLVAAIVLSAGCASTTEMDQLRSMIEQAQSTADEGVRRAAGAQATADAALQKANEANRSAAQALACCEANSEKIDRMFKKAMQK